MAGTGLFVNLIVALAVAMVGATVMARLGLPVILGYILAGIAIGPYTLGISANPSAVGTLAEIGVVLLMFAIGAQLSLGDLTRVGKVAVVGGSVQVLACIGLGYLVGVALGWPALEALFFGAILAISSSAVLTKVLGEAGEADSVHGHIALAWSTVQDLSTIVIVVLFSALSSRQGNLAVDVLYALGKATLFLGAVVLLGSRALPWLFERVAAVRSREVFIVAVAALALGTAYLSSFFGLSLALGAFVAGIAVGESDLSHQIIGEALPLRDLFASLFFVSVGMLVDPSFVVGNLPLVLATLGIIVLAKGSLTFGSSLLFGYSGRTSLLAGALLAQCGEFSFLLAQLGTGLGIVTREAYSVVLAGVVASIILSPFLYRVARPASVWLDARFARHVASGPPPAGSRDRAGRAHAVICGYGRVGRVVAAALRRRDFSFVVIEQDRRLVRALQAQGVRAFWGNAANPVLLERCGLMRARALVVAIPDMLAARQVVDYARRINPDLDIIARANTQPEREALNRSGAEEVVIGHLELALEMTRYTLHRFGVSALETQAILRGLRGRIEIKGPGEIEGPLGPEW